MTKEEFKKLGDECFNHLKEINPNGGIREFIRVAVEFGYKKAVNEKEKFTEAEMEDAYTDGEQNERQRCGYFDIKNYIQ